ncbi:MAG: Lrp/AsnC family transcriptional regulator [Candidatus Aenigmarchaeota archaeon]|nr:Lrp/AsnC family transcriptional regulator [Candidatus Aenigmarchaeota archaeon]
MDETDLKIMRRLEKDSRESFVDIAEVLGVTEGTVRNRVARLMKSGHIRRFTVDFRAPFEAAVMVSVDAKRTKRIIASLKGVSSDVYEISGSYDIVTIIKTISIESLNKAIDRIRTIRGVRGTVTSIRLG